MISEYESFVVEAMMGFYNNDYDKFFEHLDENVIWYGPKQGQYVVGKENLMKAFCGKADNLKFRVENVQTKMTTCTPSVYSLIVTYQLHTYRPDGSVRTVFQHVVVNGRKFRDRDGKIFWRCPFIHVSNAEAPKKNGDGVQMKAVAASSHLFGKDDDVKRLVFPGDNHTTVYIREDSIKYIVGGKGIMCYIHTDDGVYLIRQLLKEVMEKLPSYYYRCHSSYIVNMRKILYLSSNKITLNDKTEIPISAKKYREIKADIDSWMTDRS